MDGDIFVVNISRKFWENEMSDPGQRNSQLHKHFQKNSSVKAFLIYKKGQYIKLVPYLKEKSKAELPKNFLGNEDLMK